MNVVERALEQVYGALDLVVDPGSGHKVRLHRGAFVSVDPPGTAVGPPRLVLGGMDPQPTEAIFPVGVIARRDERTITALIRLTLATVAALHEIPDAVVSPDLVHGTWPSGGVDLPCYVVDVAFALC